MCAVNENIFDLIIWAAEDKKADDIRVIDLPEDCTIGDKFVICSGATSIQVKAIAQRILEVAKENEYYPGHFEGMDQGLWVLLDFGDIVVHIFTPALREFYNLERLWSR